MEQKIGEILKKSNEHSTVNKSYAQAINNGAVLSSLKKILHEDKMETTKIKLTACNLIIHWLEESMEDSKEELVKEDTQYMENQVFKDMGLQIKVVM